MFKLGSRIFLALALLSGRLFAEPAVLIIISPHNEAIRYEFGRGFDAWHRQRFGQGVTVEWRDVGGTADALRFVRSEFAAKPGGIGTGRRLIFFTPLPLRELGISSRGSTRSA